MNWTAFVICFCLLVCYVLFRFARALILFDLLVSILSGSSFSSFKSAWIGETLKLQTMIISFSVFERRLASLCLLLCALAVAPSHAVTCQPGTSKAAGDTCAPCPAGSYTDIEDAFLWYFAFIEIVLLVFFVVSCELLFEVQCFWYYKSLYILNFDWWKIKTTKITTKQQ